MESFSMKEKSAPPYLEMGLRIVEVRETLTNLNQSQMQEALGLRDPTYGNYERGWRKMPPHVMHNFQKLTGCSADYVYLGTGPIKLPVADEYEARFLELIRSMGSEQREMYLSMGKGWLKEQTEKDKPSPAQSDTDKKKKEA